VLAGCILNLKRKSVQKSVIYVISIRLSTFGGTSPRRPTNIDMKSKSRFIFIYTERENKW